MKVPTHDKTGECACERPAVIKQVDVPGSDWYCGKCSFSLHDRWRPSSEGDALEERARRLRSYSGFVDEFGEPAVTIPRAQLRERREHFAEWARLHPDHRGAAAAARYLAEPERVREGHWKFADGLSLQAWELEDGTVGFLHYRNAASAPGRLDEN